MGHDSGGVAMAREFVRRFVVLAVGLLIICTSMFAHHGTAASFDNTHRLTVKATVTQFVWANPHCQLYLDVKNDKGEVVNWGIELLSPGNLVKTGWTKNTFKPGDELLVSFVPAKGDRPFGICARYFRPADGWKYGTDSCGYTKLGQPVSSLPQKPGYTTVEVQMPKDDGKASVSQDQ
jgi:hypothetical protein